MHNKIEELTRKIHREGLEKAQKEAEIILAEARKEAAHIRDEAISEAEKIRTGAKKEAEDHSRRMQAELAEADCVVVVTDHSSVDYGFIARHAAVVVDNRAGQAVRVTASWDRQNLALDSLAPGERMRFTSIPR